MAQPTASQVPPTAAAGASLPAHGRAVAASGVGLGVQAALAVAAFVLQFVALSQISGSALFIAVLGVVPWAATLVAAAFRRAAVVEDFELEAARREGESAARTIFESELDARPAARRLERVYKLLLPAAGVILGLGLALAGFALFRGAASGAAYEVRNARLAAGLYAGLAFLGFIAGRYLLGLSDAAGRGRTATDGRPFALLRGGAVYLLGTSLVLAATALAAGAAALGSDTVAAVLRYVLPLILLVVGVEVLLNLVLDLYRPRPAGAAPRPAFESRLLGLLASPGGAFKGIGQAVNYQFGFEVTRSWFWRVLSKSAIWLLLLGATLLVLLSSLVFVQPHEMALVTRLGRLDAEPLGPGLSLKLPWPLSSATRFPVGRVQVMAVGSHDSVEHAHQGSYLWTNQEAEEDKLLLVAASANVSDSAQIDGADATPGVSPTPADESAEAVEQNDPSRGGRAPAVALAAAELLVQFKIDEANLFDYATSSVRPDYRLRHMADAALQREMLAYDIDAAIGPARLTIAEAVATRLRDAVAQERLGIEILWVGLAGVHPPQAAAESFNSTAASEQLRRQQVQQGLRDQAQALVRAAGSVEAARRIVAEYDALERLRRDGDEADVERQEARLERLVQEAGGAAALELLRAREQRWRTQNEALGRSLIVPADFEASRGAPEYYMRRRYFEALAQALADKPKTVLGAGVEQLDTTFDQRQTFGIDQALGGDFEAAVDEQQ